MPLGVAVLGVPLGWYVAYGLCSTPWLVTLDPCLSTTRGPVLVDDAAIFPPGDAPLHEATAAYGASTAEDGAELVGTFVLRDTDLPLVRGVQMPLSVVVTGGAGQLAGPAGLCRRARARPRRSGDRPARPRRPGRERPPRGRRARRAGAVGPGVRRAPATPAEHGWLAAADVVAEAELRLKFRTGGLDAAAYPTSEVLAGWIDAALDRETPFKCTAGLHRAVRHTGEDGLRAPRLPQRAGARPSARSTAPRRDEVVETLEERDPARHSTAARRLAGAALVPQLRLLLGRASPGTTCASWASSRDRLRARPPALRRLLGRRRPPPGRRPVRGRCRRLGARPVRRDRPAGVRQPVPQRVPRARDRGVAADPRRGACAGRGRRPHRAARRRHAAPAGRGRRLRRLLRLARPRDQRREDVPARRRRAHAELAAPADRLPRPGRHGRRVGDTGRATVGRGLDRLDHRTPPSPTFGPSQRLDIEAELGFVVGVAVADGRAGAVHRPGATTSSA